MPQASSEISPDGRLERARPLLGDHALSRLATLRIAVFGVGGVGSWCAEALARSAPSNLNRQCEATAGTIGASKVEAMKARLLSIVPDIEIETCPQRFTPDSQLPDVDIIVDAIDSVDAKAALILAATEKGVPIVSSMGAALRRDPTKVEVRRFDKVAGDGLARALRQRFKRLGRHPARKFTAVCSVEPPADLEIRASLMQVTAAFGMALASEVIRIAGE